MAKAFLSHSSQDKQLVAAIATALGSARCHYDRLTFEAGGKTIDEIFDALDETDVFVFFISNAALESEWVKKEIRKARKNISDGIVSRLLPIIIDKSITNKDPRIPSWIRVQYNLRFIGIEVLILKKIRQALRVTELKQHKHLRELNELFAGRNDLMQEFETKFIKIDGTIPTCIIAYSYIEGIGRKTFLKNALRKVNMVDKMYEPILIPIETKESIEDYIYKLNLINPEDKIVNQDFSELTIGEKLQIARELTLQFVNSNEIIFIEDQGSIILPNTRIADWFQSLLTFPEFQNRVCFCIVARYKPNPFTLGELDNTVSFRISELSKPDTQNLFLQYLRIMGTELSTNEKSMFIDQLNGVPAQAIYAANIISASTVINTRELIVDIQEYSDQIALSIFAFFSNDEYTRQVLILLSKIELVSFELISQVFEDEERLRASLQALFDLSAFNFMFSGGEYLKLNSAIADYINRSRIQLDPVYDAKLKALIKGALLDSDLDKILREDYSQFLLTLKSMVLDGRAIPKKFFIPSYILKTIVQEYYDDNYKAVIRLAVKLLENSSNYDPQVIRETKYWLCQAYARTKDDKFFEVVKYFKQPDRRENKDYYFLLGFFNRCTRNLEKAEEYYRSVLEIDDAHSRTKRELVIVYLILGDYPKALGLAKENYQRFPTNIYHCQAYFTCVIKKHNLTSDEIDEIREIMDMVDKSLHQRAREIFDVMRGEYECYVNRNVFEGIKILQESLKVHDRKFFAFRSLQEIYKKHDMKAPLNNLQEKYGYLSETDPEEKAVSED